MPGRDADVNQMNWERLRDEVTKLRAAIRYHHDQIGDQRCHLDDDKLYEVLPEGKTSVVRKLPCNFLENCKQFFKHRQNVEYTSIDELYAGWDEDKPYLSRAIIEAVISMLKQASEEFSNNGCNEFPLENTDGNWELFLKYMDSIGETDKDNRTRPMASQAIYINDDLLCDYLIWELKKLL